MWFGWSGFQLRMSLGSDHAGMISELDHLDKRSVRTGARDSESMLFEFRSIAIVKFVAVTVAFRNDEFSTLPTGRQVLDFRFLIFLIFLVT